MENDQGEPVVPASWATAATETISRDTVDASLPHRSRDEQAAIASCFAGVTTWQRIAKAFDFDLLEVVREHEARDCWCKVRRSLP